MKHSTTKLVAAALLCGAALPAAAGAYADQNAAETCGYLPYRATGPERFAAPRSDAAQPANVGPQAMYPFAWDLARPAFHAVEVAEDLLAGKPVAAVRDVHSSALSLGEYMLHASAQFAAAQPSETPADERLALAAERPRTFHRIYAHSKATFDGVVAQLSAERPDPAALAPLADAWRPAYALVAKAQADDKRLELLTTDLDADAVAEKEAVACLAHAVAALATDGGALARAQASTARWAERPAVNVRELSREARTAFFDREDAGDDLAALILGLPAGPVEDAAMQDVAKAYADFVTAAKSLHEQTRAE